MPTVQEEVTIRHLREGSTLADTKGTVKGNTVKSSYPDKERQV